MENPKVFISHASEDKDRFVKKFASKLRNHGVDAWLDKWEIKLGDSLVDKIFEEGMKECSAFIIILSENSVDKKWVREELNSAVVQRIEKSTKIIPIKIDKDIAIPTSINHLVRINITNLEQYEKEFEDIINSIFEVDAKPLLGEVSKYITHDFDVPGFNKIDSLVLKAMGDVLMKRNRFLFQGSDIINELSEYEISNEAIAESLDVFESQGLIKITPTFGGPESCPLRINPSGFLRYAEIFVGDFDEIRKGVISSIMNDNLTNSEEIANKVRCKNVLVVLLLEYYNNLGYIHSEMFLGGSASVFEIKSVGKRYFRELLSN